MSNTSAVETLTNLVADDMQAVNKAILERMQSPVALIPQLAGHLIAAGGKRLRPMLTLASAHLLDYQGDKHIGLAACVEFIHTATLLHDDVVDNSDMRRGRETANSLWGNEASVLVGDFLYTRSFEMMVEMDSMRLMKILSHTTNIIAEGEVLQLLNCHDADTTEESYLEVIHHKTAKLFEAAGLLGAVITNSSTEIENAMSRYAMHLGSAFQLVDDLLDYSESSETIGKNIGDDLAEGKPTLPLIYALDHCSETEKTMIQHAIKHGGLDHLDEIIAAVKNSGGIEYTIESAEREADNAIQALNVIPESKYRDAMIGLARLAVNRNA